MGRLNRHVAGQLMLRRLPPVHGGWWLPVRHVAVVRWLRPRLLKVDMTGHGCCSIDGRRGVGRFGLVRGGGLSSGTMLWPWDGTQCLPGDVALHRELAKWRSP